MFALIFGPRVDRADDGLAAFVNRNVLNRDFLLPASA
jgi:hypothetical protein